jgi:hypothetical protein
MKTSEGIPIGENEVVLVVDRWTEPKDSLIAVSVLEKLFTSTQLLQTLKNLLLRNKRRMGDRLEAIQDPSY